ncbi:MAG: hypothetical protein Q9193_000990 [Seirophora villosa]
MSNQWRNPNDVLTVLLIIGGDIVQKALAQLSGGSFVPVAFSFGWVSYSFNALLAAFGDGALMPPVPAASILINARSGYTRQNHSWILERLLRSVERDLEPLDAALCVSVFDCKAFNSQAHRDWFWWSGVFTTLFQLAIAIIPCALQNDWSILLVTVTGTALALTGGSLSQWRKEKWGARLDNKKTSYCLTRGNGLQHVVVICNQSHGCLRLEDLAVPRRESCSRRCKVIIAFSALVWILILINVAGLKRNTWYLLGVGFAGMVQNLGVAGIPRRPDAMGMPLQMVARIQSRKVMLALMDTERQFPSVGLALVSVFFPGELSDEEHKFWATRRERQRNRNCGGLPFQQPAESSRTSLSRNANTSWTASPPQTTPAVTIAPHMSPGAIAPIRRSSV